MKSTPRNPVQGNPIGLGAVTPPNPRSVGDLPILSGKKSSRGTSSLTLSEGEELYVGVDCHKSSYSVSIFSVDRKAAIKQWKQDSEDDALVAALAPIRDHVRLIVYEAGPTGFHLARRLTSSGLATQVIAPSLTPRPSGRREKSDRLDAAKLAEFASKGLLSPVAVPKVEEEGARDVLRLRQTSAKNLRRQMVQIHALLLKHGVTPPENLERWSIAAIRELQTLQMPSAGATRALQLMVGELLHLRSRTGDMTRSLSQVVKSPEYAERIERLRGIGGIGRLTAAAVVLELFQPERFERGEQVAKYVGLSPCICASGETVKQEGRIPGGTPRLRELLIEGAWRWTRLDEGAGRRMAELTAKTGSKKKAIVAMARRLLVVMWRMLVTGEPYLGFQRCNAKEAA